MPANFRDRCQHQRADEDQCGSCGGGRDDTDEWRRPDSGKKQQTGDDGGHAGAPAGGDARCGFDIARHCRCADHGAEDGCGGVSEQDPIEAGNRVIGGNEPGTLGDGDERPQIVEEIDEEEDEDDFEQALIERAANIEFEECAGKALKAAARWCPMHKAHGPGDPCDDENADENGAADFPDFEGHHENEAKQRKSRGRVADVAETDKGGGIADDQAGVAKADESDEETDAAGDGCVKFMRDGAQNHLADAGGSEREKDDAGEKHRAQRRLPGDVHLEADGVGEVGVEAHAGRERDGIARDDAHQNGAECRRETGGRRDRRQAVRQPRRGWRG